MVPILSLLVVSMLAAVGLCNPITTGQRLDIYALAVYEEYAIIRWRNYDPTDQGELLDWTIYYRVAPVRNVIICSNKETCDADHANGLNGNWMVLYLPPMDRFYQSTFEATIVPDLEPSTQYAVFACRKHRDTATWAVTTDLIYFTTKVARSYKQNNE